MLNRYTFKDELKLWLLKTQLTRKDLINLLQDSNFNEFRGLDNITVSRWATGSTTPPLYKQFYIAKYLGIDIIDIILRVEPSSLKASEKMSKAFKSLVKQLDFSPLSLSYKKQPEQVFCKVKEQTFQEHYNDYSDFHNNICALQDYFQELYSFKDLVKYKSITLENSSGETLAHYSGITEIELLGKFKIFRDIQDIDLSKSCLINIGFFKSSKHYFELLDYAICYYLLKFQKQKEHLYLFVAGYALFDITKNLLGITEIAFFPPKTKHSKLGVYFFKIDILKAICNPLLFNSAKDKLRCLNSCHENRCSLCNLIDYR